MIRIRFPLWCARIPWRWILVGNLVLAFGLAMLLMAKKPIDQQRRIIDGLKAIADFEVYP